uniref:Family with sequence similarity 237 member B n=1 Tax=Salmo trutta TaxID=8032 RepID=A0A674EDB0_SALTR
LTPGNLDEIDSGCWDSSSLAGIQTRRLRLADSRGALWDFMTYLRASQRQKHNELFLELAQHFWAMYVDCMLSRAHGLGKRGFTTTLAAACAGVVESNEKICSSMSSSSYC